MNILVTGGAGYIGSIAVRKLCDQGHKVTVIDNLSKGIQKLVDIRATFIKGDICEKNSIVLAFETSSPDLIIHFAAYKDAGESMTKPEHYSMNIIGLINVLDCMVKYKTAKIIFSSTAAVYGNPQYIPLDEHHPTAPINYYGFTKLACEQAIQWYGKIHNIKYINLRYFNVIGDGGLGYIDPKPSNIAPIIMETLFDKRTEFHIFGNDYNTPDGTCIRDYIDVNDLVNAHILAITHDKSDTFNLGTEQGYSVLDLIKTAEQISGKKLKKVIKERRAGDPPILTATFHKAKQILQWSPQITLEKSIKDIFSVYAKQQN